MNAPSSTPSASPLALPEAIRDLNRVCADVGLPVVVCPNLEDPGREATLGTANQATVRQLADLLRTSMRRTYDTVAALSSALEAHGLKSPEPGVQAGEIVLGDLSLSDAVRLAELLGVPRWEPTDPLEVELADWFQSQVIVDRLGRAFREATGEFLDLLFHHGCHRCGRHTPVISTGAFPVATALRLLEALEYGDGE
ncbi:hypothetical protein ACH41E_30425 [Streptomyces sp. NPDC020412]|uniref:hypothetical protein n=1 Tax=Streptomyces sp. NPDC020412 TaxID=3365073 RepID=UPI0037923EFF